MTGAHDPLVRLQQHSGLPTPGDEIPDDTLMEFIVQKRRGGQMPSLDAITTDIIACLDCLNRKVNQGTGPASDPGSLDRQLVYAASGIVGRCLDKALELRRADAQSALANDLLRTAWRVQCAWDALVAGDEEDLPSVVALEERARFGGGL